MSSLCQLIIHLLCVALSASRKSNRKYPFYRPDYKTTTSVFGPFVEILNSPQIASDHDELFQFLSTRLKPQRSYHNSSQFQSEVDHLIKLSASSLSPWFSILSIEEEAHSVEGRPLHRVVLTDKSISSDQKRKMLMIFGEHPREFIVSESMLDLVSNVLLSFIASSEVFSREYVLSILSHFEVHLIPILNPDGKVVLEKSDNFCWRWTGMEKQVDLNRNFEWMFGGKRGSTHRKGTEEWHGDHAFSEPEAEFVHKLLTEQNYSVVLDIHSGTQQIFVPFVDTESRKTHRTRPETPEELRLVDWIQSHSGGWFKDSGIAWKYNDYGADGSILDYLGGVAHVPYSLCAEIYGDPTVDNSIDCFVQFNPNNGEHFESTMKSIRSLYTGTFDYFLSVEQQLSEQMVSGVAEMKRYLYSVIDRQNSDPLR